MQVLLFQVAAKIKENIAKLIALGNVCIVELQFDNFCRIETTEHRNPLFLSD